MAARDGDVVDWTSIWRLVKVGGFLIAGTLAIAAYTSRLSAIEMRLETIEANGAIPIQRDLKAVQDTVNAVRSDHIAMRHLLCLVPEVSMDSQCTARNGR